MIFVHLKALLLQIWPLLAGILMPFFLKTRLSYIKSAFFSCLIALATKQIIVDMPTSLYSGFYMNIARISLDIELVSIYTKTTSILGLFLSLIAIYLIHRWDWIRP